MEVKEVKFLDGSGGLNNRDQPSQIQQNEFTKLENLLTDEGGWPGKKRLGQLLMQYAPIEPEPFQGVLGITALSGPGPGLITITCANTSSLRVGMSLTFYNAVPAILGAPVIVTSIINATQFTGTNTVAFAIGNKFKQTGTLHLYHFNGAGFAPEPDDTIFEATSPFAIADLGVGGLIAPLSKPGLFPIATPLSRQAIPAVDAVFSPNQASSFFKSSGGPLIEGLSSIFFESWVYINPTFSGKPVITTDAFGSGLDQVTTNSGVHILATQNTVGLIETEARNGLSIFRDWDSVNNTDTSDPYVTFTIRTNSGGVTTIRSQALPTSTWLFIRGSYIQSSNKVRLRVNGYLEAEAITTGTIDDNNGTFGPGFTLRAGGAQSVSMMPFFSFQEIGFDGRIEEARIRTGVTDAEESIFPLKEGRGKPWPLVKSNGTKQLIVGAGDSMFYTVGDGAWVKMNDAAKDVLGAEIFSSVADWDAIQVGDSLFLQDGIDAPKTWDGSKLYPWGNPVSVPTLALGGAPGIGNPLGVHSYYMTFLYGTIETGPSPIFSINTTAVGQSVSFTNIPLGAPGCTGRKIYRVKISGANAGRRYLFRQISDNVTTALTAAFVSNTSPLLDTGNDGLADATLSTGAYVEMTAAVQFSAIPKGKYLLANNNRGWIAGNDNDPYAAFYTELNAMHTCLPLSYVRATSDSGPLIGLAKYYGETQASKGGKATLVLRGDNPSNWTQWEILHPTIGAIDHWSYVHRTIPGSDSYRLCFWGEDGAYSYAGQDFEKISDMINGTAKTLAVNNGNRQAIIVTTKTDWESAPANSGFISQNAYSPTYEQDGTREVPGQLRSVNQLDYIALWKGSAPLVPANVIAIEKGPLEGEFVFAVDSDANLYRTTDNFVSKAILTTLPSGTHRIIEIRYALIAAVDTYFLFEADPTTESGAVMRWDGALTTVSAGPFFWQADTAWRAGGGGKGLYHVGIGNHNDQSAVGFLPWTGIYAAPLDWFNNGANGANNYGNNVYLNHSQKLNFSATGGTAGANVLKRGGGSPTGVCSTVAQLNWYGLTPATQPVDFYSLAALLNNMPVIIAPASPVITLIGNGGNNFLDGTHRETAFFKGGTFRPQSFWDGRLAGVGGQKLYFVGAGAEDANGNRTSNIYSLTPAGVLTSIASGQSYYAITTDADPTTPRCWFTDVTRANPNFTATLKKFTLTTPVVTTVGNLTNSILPLRLNWNTSNGRLVAVGKQFTDYMFTYSGLVGNLNTATGAWTSLKNFTAVNNTGALPIEIAYQNTTPFAHYIAMQKIQATEPDAVYEVNAASAIASDVVLYKGGTYMGQGAIAAVTGVISNLLFVPASGAPNFLWADRLYWYAPALLSADSRLLQLGVPGTWKVRVNYTSQAFAAGAPSSFDAFQTDYQGVASFFLRNAALIGGLVVSEQAITPNQNINVFSPPAALVQFRILLDWDYSVAVPVVSSPYIENVNIGYFLGLAVLPRVVGWHWKGRTCWSVAQVGQTKNNLVLVFQKNGRWTTYTGWNIKGTAEFLGRLVALQGFELVQIEVGDKDKGNLIRTKARTGSIMDDATDKCIRDIKFNLQSYVNNNFPTKSGYIKIVPVGADTKLAANWIIEIPATPTVEPRQILGVTNPAAPFPYVYARAFALEIFTSDEVGTYAPAVDQQENMAGLIARFFVSSPRELIVRP